MTKEITKNPLDSLPEEIKNEIQRDGMNYSRESVNMPPTIGVSTDDDTIGQFYIDEKDKEGETKREMLGKTLDIVLLKERKTFSYYNTDTKKLELFTNELDTYNGRVDYLTPVVLKGGEGDIIFEGSYEQFLEAKKTNWIDEAKSRDYVKSLLKQKTLLYVLIPSKDNKICRLFVNLSSAFGVDPSGGYLFKNPQAGSLEAIRNSKKGIAPYTYIVTLSNVRGEGSIPWRQLVFTVKEDVSPDKIMEMFNIKKELEEYFNTLDNYFGVKRLMSSERAQVKPDIKELNPGQELPTINVDEEEPVKNDSVSAGLESEDDIKIDQIPF